MSSYRSFGYTYIGLTCDNIYYVAILFEYLQRVTNIYGFCLLILLITTRDCQVRQGAKKIAPPGRDPPSPGHSYLIYPSPSPPHASVTPPFHGAGKDRLRTPQDSQRGPRLKDSGASNIRTPPSHFTSLKTKNPPRKSGGHLFWCGHSGLNRGLQSQSLLCYRYTMPVKNMALPRFALLASPGCAGPLHLRCLSNKQDLRRIKRCHLVR